jgi:predicted small secreted protein
MYVKFSETGAAMKKVMKMFILAILIITSTACNTFQGLGKDIEKGGQAIERAANK